MFDFLLLLFIDRLLREEKPTWSCVKSNYSSLLNYFNPVTLEGFGA